MIARTASGIDGMLTLMPSTENARLHGTGWFVFSMPAARFALTSTVTSAARRSIVAHLPCSALWGDDGAQAFRVRCPGCISNHYEAEYCDTSVAWPMKFEEPSCKKIQARTSKC